MPADSQQPEFDFEYGLPAGRQMFTLKELAGWWAASLDTLYRLYECGEFEPEKGEIGPINLAVHAKTTRAMIRVPRSAVIAFIKRRRQ